MVDRRRTPPASPASRAIVRSILDAALRAVDGGASVRACTSWDGDYLEVAGWRARVPPAARVLVVGAGKAAARMARGLEEVLGARLDGGLVVVKDGHGEALDHLELREASHPIPDERAVAAADEALALVAGAAPEDLVIVLLSGGASALLVRPAPGLGLEDLQEADDVLLRNGLEIDELNAVRKHLSAISGGRLARAASPARVVSLIVSDVIGDRLDTIGSGPTTADPTTYAECLEILERRSVMSSLPSPVLAALREGAAGGRPETVAPDDVALGRVRNVVVASNSQALEAARAEAAGLGFAARVLTRSQRGEARDVGQRLAAQARDLWTMEAASDRLCLLAGGETTVTMAGRGRGGRNQEMTLAAARVLSGVAGVTFCSVGTDGTDGPTEAAGAIADGRTVERAVARGLDPDDFLARNDSYTFFAALDDLVITGPTGTNVMDMQIILIDPVTR